MQLRTVLAALAAVALTHSAAGQGGTAKGTLTVDAMQVALTTAAAVGYQAPNGRLISAPRVSATRFAERMLPIDAPAARPCTRGLPRTGASRGSRPLCRGIPI